jgi:hypothetical protein
MGYNFIVGNAVPKHSKDDFPELRASWQVEIVELPEAPSFPNDVANHSNYRSPTYSAWANFCRNTGLYEFFYDECGHLHARHPGCIGITKEDADFVTAALNRYRAKATLPPGFEKGWDHQGPPNYDYDLARLIWLEWWMQWAVKYCETPAIENS